MKYSIKCTCGDVMTVEAENREEAVEKLKGMMSEEALKAHFDEKHPGQSVPAKADSDAMIEQMTVEGDLNETQSAA